jgi:hypothetical protein
MGRHKGQRKTIMFCAFIVQKQFTEVGLLCPSSPVLFLFTT